MRSNTKNIIFSNIEDLCLNRISELKTKTGFSESTIRKYCWILVKEGKIIPNYGFRDRLLGFCLPGSTKRLREKNRIGDL